MQDAERFKGIMFSGARHELLAAVVAIGVGLTLPWLGIAFASGMHSDPAGFFAVFLLTAITTCGLVLACFYDAYGPVIEAQRQAAQQKAFNIAITVGQASVDVALAASAPKEALKTIQRTKDGKVRILQYLSVAAFSVSLSLYLLVHVAHAVFVIFVCNRLRLGKRITKCRTPWSRIPICQLAEIRCSRLTDVSRD